MKIYLILFFVIFVSGCAGVQDSCIEGSTKSGYIPVTTKGKMSCEAGLQTCLHGKWDGPDLADSCDDFKI